MYKTILKILEEIQDSQINIKSETARKFLANKITEAILKENSKESFKVFSYE